MSDIETKVGMSTTAAIIAAIGLKASTMTAAEITSALASLGLGSMARGLVVVAGTPAIIGYGVYRLVKWLK